MKNPLDHLKIRLEIRQLVKFARGYFGDNLLKVVVFGSFLSWLCFKKFSDVDIVLVLKDSDEYRISGLEECWYPDNSDYRRNFLEAFRLFRMSKSFWRIYDIKIFTEKDIDLIREYQKQNPPSRGGCIIDDINSGQCIFSANLI